MPISGLDHIITVFTHFQAVDYTLLAGTTIWFYDILLTLNDELTLLWTRGSTFIKILYLINRYLPLVGLPLALTNSNPFPRKPFSARRCRVQFTIMTLSQTIGVIVATTIFMVRLYTAFCFHRKIRIFLVLMLVGSHICMLVFTIMLLEGTVPNMIYSDVLRTCMSIPSKALGAVYVTPIFIESVIAFATVFHAWSYRYSSTNFQSSSMKAVIKAIYVDGFLYYMLVLIARIGTALVYWVGPPSLLFLCFFEYAFLSTITSRWFLSFRKVLAESFTSTTGPMTTGTAGIGEMTTTSGVITGPAIEFSDRGPYHSQVLSVGQDATKTDTSLEPRD
ncbi:hypothetical protein CPB86DRAFT_52931 [Serendipita vermifera]|nr:hypothetical protein CPB86DRAFT_52931 [Serendipita vermifera]